MTELPFNEVAIQVPSGYTLMSAQEFLSGQDLVQIVILVSQKKVKFLRDGVPIDASDAIQGLRSLGPNFR